MADLQYSTDVRDAQNDAIAASIGQASIMVFDGTKPGSTDEPVTGQRVIAAGKLPAPWLQGSAAGAVSKVGQWILTGQAAAGNGAAGSFFRICGADGMCKVQGSFGDKNSAALMRVDVNRIAAGQDLAIEEFTIVRGNA